MKQNKIIAPALILLFVLILSACTSNSAMNNNNSSWPGMTVEDDILYTASGTSIEAVKDGQKLWSYPETEGGRNAASYYAAPAVDDSYVYAGTFSNQLHILNKADGSLAGQIEVGNNKNKILAAPILAEDSLIVLSSGGMVSSWPAGASAAPAANWQTTLSSELWVKPVCENGTLYVASMDKKMNLLDLKSGEIKQVIDISGAIMSDPVLQDGKLYFSTLANEVDEMDLTSGEIRPLLTTDNEIWAAPLLMGGKLIAADMNGVLYCVDEASGNLDWKSEKLSAEKTGFIASPIALDEQTILVVDESGKAGTYDMSGKSVYQRAIELSVYTTPIRLSNGSIVVLPMTGDGQIRAFTQDLKEDWIYTRVQTSGNAEATATAEPAAAEPTQEQAKGE